MGVTRARELTMWKHLDLEAKCNFDKMCAAYQVGTQSECYSTLRRFACYESFKRCDSDGFQVGSCRIACESVEYFCAKPFHQSAYHNLIVIMIVISTTLATTVLDTTRRLSSHKELSL